jgi:hypothetical protein
MNREFNLSEHLGDASDKLEVIAANSEYFKFKDKSYTLISVVKAFISKDLIKVDGNSLILDKSIRTNVKDGIRYISAATAVKAPKF